MNFEFPFINIRLCFRTVRGWIFPIALLVAIVLDVITLPIQILQMLRILK
jgi:hypothetical protein